MVLVLSYLFLLWPSPGWDPQLCGSAVHPRPSGLSFRKDSLRTDPVRGFELHDGVLGALGGVVGRLVTIYCIYIYTPRVVLRENEWDRIGPFGALPLANTPESNEFARCFGAGLVSQVSSGFPQLLWGLLRPGVVVRRHFYASCKASRLVLIESMFPLYQASSRASRVYIHDLTLRNIQHSGPQTCGKVQSS